MNLNDITKHDRIEVVGGDADDPTVEIWILNPSRVMRSICLGEWIPAAGDCVAAGWVFPVYGEGAGTETEYTDWTDFVAAVNDAIREL